MNVGNTKAMRISRQSSRIQIVINQRQVGNVECFSYLGFMINDSRCTREVKSKIAMAKGAFNKKKTFHRQVGFKSREESGKVLVKCYTLNIALCGTETWHFGKQNRNNESSELRWWRNIQNII